MAENAYPFDSGTGSVITENDWSNLASTWQDDGIIQGDYFGGTLVVYTNVELNKVHLNTGAAMLKGFRYENTQDLIIPFATGNVTNPRIDRVVLRLDRNANTIRAVLIQGTPAVSPTLPALTNAFPIFEMPLAQIKVIANATTVASADITYDYSVVGKRVQASAAIASLPYGSVAYHPNTGKFMTNGSLGVETISTSLDGRAVPVIAATSTTRPAHKAGQLIYETDTKQILLSDGTAWATPFGMGFIKRKAANATIATTTAQIADPDLAVPVVANSMYNVTGKLIYQNNTNGETIGLTFNGPTAFNASYQVRYFGSASTTEQYATGVAFPFSAGPGTPSSATWYVCHFEIQLFVQTGGTLQLSTTNNNVASTTILRQGSFIRSERVG